MVFCFCLYLFDCGFDVLELVVCICWFAAGVLLVLCDLFVGFGGFLVLFTWFVLCFVDLFCWLLGVFCFVCWVGCLVCYFV